MNTLPFLIISVIKVGIILFILLTACAYIVWLERKLIGRIQNRWGPTRVGPFGLLQPMADGVKFILKEDIIPDNVNRFWYVLAPMIALVFALCSIAVIPDSRAVHRWAKLTVTLFGSPRRTSNRGLVHLIRRRCWMRSSASSLDMLTFRA